MAYSHVRLRKTLALVRMVTGAIFLLLGSYKISSMEFARVGFPQFLWEATHGGAVGFYGSLLETLAQNSSKYAVLVGFVELFIGIGLLLGLVVRPIALLGMAYMVNLMLATWFMPGPDQPFCRYLSGQMSHISLFLLFLLLGIGRAGENWGLGSLYHHRRHLRWEQNEPLPPPHDLDRAFEGEAFPDDDNQGLPPVSADVLPPRL